MVKKQRNARILISDIIKMKCRDEISTRSSDRRESLFMAHHNVFLPGLELIICALGWST